MKTLLLLAVLAVGSVSVNAQTLPVWSGRKIFVENPTALTFKIGHGWSGGLGPTYTIQPGAVQSFQWPADMVTLQFWASSGIIGGATSYTPSTTDQDLHVQFWEDTGAALEMVECYEGASLSYWFWVGTWQGFAVFMFGVVLRIVRQMGRTSPEL